MNRYIYLILLLSNILFAQSLDEKSGSAANLFLRTELTPRAVAMSGAFTAVAGDESALLYNPAGLVGINFFNASFNHTSWFRDIRFEHLLIGYKLDRNLALAFSIAQLGMPDIQGKDEAGFPTEKLRVSSTVATLGIGYKISQMIYAGVNIKYFQDALAGFEASGTAIDFGLYSARLVQGLTLGLAIQNLSGEVQYDQSKEKIPLQYRAGAAYKLSRINTLLALDLVESTDSNLHLNLGAEYRYAGLLSLRIGNRFRQGDLLQFSAGVGLEMLDHYFIDYAFQNNPDLGQVHRFGIAFRLKRETPSYLKYKKVKSAVPEKLPVPQKLNYEISKEVLQIRWQSISGMQYNVYARTEDSKMFKKINRHPLYANQTQFKKPAQTKKLFIVVTSILGDKESAFSKELKINVR